MYCLRGHRAPVLCVHWAADGSVASGDRGGDVLQWDVETACASVHHKVRMRDGVGWEKSSRGRFATPAAFRSPGQGLHVRRGNCLSFKGHGCPVPKLRIRNFHRLKVLKRFGFRFQQPEMHVATPQAARGWVHSPCGHFKIQSCFCRGSAFEVAAFQTPKRLHSPHAPGAPQGAHKGHVTAMAGLEGDSAVGGAAPLLLTGGQVSSLDDA